MASRTIAKAFMRMACLRLIVLVCSTKTPIEGSCTPTSGRASCKGDHQLLQRSHEMRRSVSPAAAPCNATAVQRRRRNEIMCSCRRRSGSDQGWKCVDDTVAIDESYVPPSCNTSAVQRRRRNENMCSCRRRSGSDQGWKCVDDTVAVDESYVPPSCNTSAVQRRRRNEDMCSCRRRSGSDRGWKCVGDAVEIDESYVPPPPPPPDSELLGYPATGDVRGGDNNWCSIREPDPTWDLKTCEGDGSLQVKLLTYNLFWWNLFNIQGGGRASNKIRDNSDPMFDVMAFQECDDPYRVINGAGVGEYYGVVRWGSNAIAYLKSRWREVASGITRTSEDRPEQFYGRRGVHWVRLWNPETNKTLFFLNHHGPLPVGTGGICGGTASAFNMLKVAGENAYNGDNIILTGDFNANRDSSYVRALETKIHRIFTGTKIGGIDHFFSSCDRSRFSESINLGSGGSDHDALMTILNF